MKILKKILLFAFFTALSLVISLVVSVFLFQDRIIRQFIREANKNLGTPVKIGSMEVTALQDFPNLSIVFYDVYVEDSHAGEYPLLTAKKISFKLNTIEVWQGRYHIEGLTVDDSETNLRINKAGQNNYTIVKRVGEGGGAVTFDLQNVALKNTLVSYVDVSAGQNHEFSSEALAASITADRDQYHILAKGNVVTEQIGIGRSIFFRKKAFEIDAILDYDDLGKSLKISPSQLLMGKAQFEVSGAYAFKEEDFVDLITHGKNADIQTLISFLPESSVEYLRKYESKGEAYFDLTLKGTISKRKSPFLSVAFGLKNATLFHPGTQIKVDSANLDGSFATASITRLGEAEIFLKRISGRLNSRPFTGNFVLTDFNDPYVTADFQGELDASDIQKFYPQEFFSGVTGRMKADVSLQGLLSLLKNKSTAQQVRTTGTVELMDLNFGAGKQMLRFSNLNGSLQFNHNDLAMSDLHGKFENSDFILNGFFKNIVTFLIFENQPVGIEADLKSEFLDVDQLFAIGFGTEEKGPYKFSISNNLHLNFNYEVGYMKFKKFHPTQIKGDLLVKGQMAVARKISLNAMGGNLTLTGIVDAKNSKAIDLVSSVRLDGIHIDSLFYVFGDFRQDFISSTHLKGQTYADISMEATLNEDLHMFPETLIADVSATIKNGELNNFQPMKQLNRYLDDEGLGRLRFADIKNDIHIENKTVYIPKMEIKSNVTVIELNGTHTFDGKIDYRVIAPLRNKKKIDPDEALGAVEDDLKGRSKVHFKITGTTDDYKVSFDTEAVRKKIGRDLAQEVKELKDVFRLKGKKKKKELELAKDDYFDWKDNQ